MRVQAANVMIASLRQIATNGKILIYSVNSGIPTVKPKLYAYMYAVALNSIFLI